MEFQDDLSIRHAKILRDGIYRVESSKYVVEAPKAFRATKEQLIDESEKRIEELHSEVNRLDEEIENRKDRAEREGEEIIEKAEQEAQRIVKGAEDDAFDRVKKSLDDKENVINERNQESDKIINDARMEADRIIEEAREEASVIKRDARKEGYDEGREEGFRDGRSELESMVDRLKKIIYTTINEREKIIVHSEKQIVNLVLTMVKKIIKKLTIEEENVVINNVKEALAIVRSAMKVYIHVNPEDFEYTQQFKDEFIRLIEGMPEVKIFENPTIDRGGVKIETDIGEIDATIATQLEEIEDKIRFYLPMKLKTRDFDDSVINNQQQTQDVDEYDNYREEENVIE